MIPPSNLLCRWIILSILLGSVANAADANQLRRELSNVQGQVTTLQLIDANTDMVITELEDGMVIALDAIKSGMNGTTVALNVEALVNGTDVRSVRFGLNGNKYFKTESNAPFAMCGNTGSNYHSCGLRLGLGKHTITATPRNRNGQTGRPVTMTIEIIESDVTPPVILGIKALSPTTVDISNGKDAEVLFQVTLQDDASGFLVGDLMARELEGGDFRNNFHFFFGDMADFIPEPSIGLRNNDPVTFNITVKVRKYFPNGTIPVYIAALDRMENYMELNGPAVGELGFDNAITIINTGPVDNTDPVLISFKALSNLTAVTGNSTMRFEVVGQDDLSGIDYGILYVWNSTSQQVFGYVEFGKPGIISDGQARGYFSNGPPLPAGVPHKFTMDVKFFDENTPMGVYDLTVALSDATKNFTTAFPADLARLGFPSNVTVV